MEKIQTKLTSCLAVAIDNNDKQGAEKAGWHVWSMHQALSNLTAFVNGI